VQSLPNLHALLTQLLDLVTAAPLVDLGKVSMSLSSIANQNGGSSTVACGATGITVVGSVLPAGTCDQVHAAFAGAVSTLHNALAALPGAAAVPTPSLDGLTTTSSGAPAAAMDVTSQAAAAITPLHLTLPSVSLTAVTDSLVTSIDAAVAQLNTLLPTLSLPGATSALTGALGALGVDVSSLPTGSALAGLRTLGVDLATAGLSTSVLHNRELASVPPSVTPPGTTTPGTTTPGTTTPGTTTPGTTTPGTTTPGTTTPGTTTPGATTPTTTTPGTTTPRTTRTAHGLPFTGSETSVDAALAMLAMLAGVHLTMLGRRRRTPLAG
jgi:hypothetical protein